MQTIDTYVKESYLRLLLQGAPGSGKTTLACHFPGAYIADCDLNLAGPLRYLKGHNGTLPVGYDIIDRDEEGAEVEPINRYQRLIKCLAVAVQNPDVQTIVIDSATKLSDYMIAEVLRQQGKKEMSIPLWGLYLALWKHFISRLSAQRKNFVLIAHEKIEKDELDQSLKAFIMIPGQISFIIGSLFTDCWRCEVTSVGIPPKYSWNVRTMPDSRYALKNSFEFTSAVQIRLEIHRRQISPMKFIMITNGRYWAKVDDEDYDELVKYSWHLTKGYAWRRSSNGIHIMMHKSIIGSAPKGMEPHHIDGNKFNNQRNNLMFVSHAEHRQYHNKSNKFSYRGVGFHNQKFSAEISKDGKRYYLGMFSTTKEAAQAYDKKALELYGPNAKLNFPCKPHS